MERWEGGIDYAHPICTYRIQMSHQVLKDTGTPICSKSDINCCFTAFKTIREIKIPQRLFSFRWWVEINHHFKYYSDIFLTYFSHVKVTNLRLKKIIRELKRPARAFDTDFANKVEQCSIILARLRDFTVNCYGLFTFFAKFDKICETWFFVSSH